MENLFTLFSSVGIFACVFYILVFSPSRAVLAFIAVFMLAMTFGPSVYLYVETGDVRGVVVDGSLRIFISVGLVVAVLLKKQRRS